MSDRTVLIATGIYPPDIGGPATYAKTLVDELPKRGIRPLLLNFSPLTRFPSGLRHVLFLGKLLQKGWQADVIYALDAMSVGLPSLLASRLLRKPLVLRVGGDFAWEQAVERLGTTEDMLAFAGRRYGRRTEMLRSVQSFVACRAERIVVPSRYMRSVLEAWGVRRPIRVVHNSFELPDGVPTREEARQSLAVFGPLVVSAGRLLRFKGFQGLMEAVGIMVAENPAIWLHIIGAGPMRDELGRMIADRHLETAVALVGPLTRAETLACLRAADVFALNSAAEGFSHMILEAMALGTPVVATCAGGNPELIEDGVTGLLVAPGDRAALASAIQRLLKDPDTRSRIAQEAVRAAGRYSKEAMIDQTVAALFEAV